MLFVHMVYYVIASLIRKPDNDNCVFYISCYALLKKS